MVQAIAPACMLTVLLTAATASTVAIAPPAQAADVYGFGCYTAGSNYVVGLGKLPSPQFNVAKNPSIIPPLAGSGSFPVAVITSKIGNYPIDRRCSAIATRLTNLALATNTATPTGIIQLSSYLVAGKIGKTPVIAIESLTLGDVLATLPASMDPAQALGIVKSRIQAISAGQVISDAITEGEVVEFVVIEQN